MRAVSLGLLLFLAARAASAAPGMLLLRYRDFGPQVLAHELLGPEWWQWEAHGDSDPNTEYPVWVVVHAGIPVETVARRYAVSRGRQRDFRYVTLPGALGFLRRALREVPAGPLRARLLATRARIVAALGDGGTGATRRSSDR